ncbi:MAG: ATP-binding cassette domain-containing protein, partial [Planctomycetota bacterium]
RGWPGELITVSHDRDFLKQVTTHTMMIHRRGLRRVEGHVEKLIEQIATEEEVYEKTRLNEAKKRKQEERFIERFRYKASKAKAVQSRIKAIERRGDLEALDHERNLEFSFRDEPFHAPTVLKASELSFGYGDGPNLVEDFAVEVAKDDRIAVIGRNGKGKTTLLNLLAGELPPRTGTITQHPSAKPAYFGQTNIDRLDPESTVEDEILAVHPEHSVTAARGICGLVLFEGDQALKKVSVLSGGERSRVLLGKILVSPTNLLMLDEPTNHLDLESVESLLDAIDAFDGAVLLVTHSEMILERVANRLIIFDRGRVRLFEGTYRDFLERVGWEGEDADKPPPSSAPKISAKDRRRLRAEIVAERSKATSALRKKVEELENTIVTLEADVEAHNAELIELATGSNPERLAEVGKLSKDKTVAIETAFEELESASEGLAELESSFESRLAELDEE